MAKGNRTTSTACCATAKATEAAAVRPHFAAMDKLNQDAETLGGGTTGAACFPSETHWREYQAAVAAVNAKEADDADLEVTLNEAQGRFVYAEDATLQGIYMKLRLLAQVESLSGHLDESGNLLWPRIILTILRDLKALGSLQEPVDAY